MMQHYLIEVESDEATKTLDSRDYLADLICEAVQQIYREGTTGPMPAIKVVAADTGAVRSFIHGLMLGIKDRRACKGAAEIARLHKPI